MPSPHSSISATSSNAGTSQQQQYHHQDPKDHHQSRQSSQQQQQPYYKQHRLSRSFPSSTSHLTAPRYPPGTRSDRPQAPVSSSLGSRLDPGTSFSRKTPSPLPRTSSLLPPPLLASKSSTAQPDVVNLESGILNPVFGSESSLLLRPSTSHSRSSSAGLSSEGIRNLNRWSASTTSSRASGPNNRALSSHARRISIDASALLAPNSTYSTKQSPQSLPRNRRRSNSSEASWGTFSGGSKLRGYSPSAPTRAGSLSTDFAAYPLDFAASAFNNKSSSSSNGLSAPQGASQAFKSGYIAEHNQSWDAFSGQGRRGSAEPGSQQPFRAKMPYDRNGEAYDTRGHSRNWSQAAKGSTDTTASSRGRDRGNKPPSQKAMLSRALQKANTAVQLDNAQNFEGARQSYAEACELLHQVLARTSTDEDRRKLEAIVSQQ